MAATEGRWGDLPARAGSALVLLAVGGLAIALGGWAFWVLIVAVIAAMQWELARLSSREPAPREALAVAAAAGLTLLFAITFGGISGAVALFVPSVLLMARKRDLPVVVFLYALAIMAAGIALVLLREIGTAALIWLITVVVVSDIAGYFAGRSLGGPKFWPAISPKKTWSGTVAGWIGAALVGLGFAMAGQGGMGLVLLSPLVAFAGQLGDILESWMKRRAGVKDSSNLIPGHGGFLDRFDALLLASVVVLLLQVVVTLPLPGLN